MTLNDVPFRSKAVKGASFSTKLHDNHSIQPLTQPLLSQLLY
jgi:hypothetical protein